MAWQPTIPQAGDLLTQSQSDIQGNFAELETYIKPSTPTITMTQLAAAPGAPIANAWQLFTAPSPYGASSELSLQDDAGNVYPITQCHAATNGWTILPSGILMFWATRAAAGAVTIDFNAATAPNFPGFTNLFNVSMSFQAPAGFPNSIAYISAGNAARVTIQCTVPAVTFVSVLAIGN